MLWLVAVATVPACGEEPGQPSKPSSPPCVTTADCETDNPCALGTCNPVTGACNVTAVPNGLAPNDELGNCLKVLCHNGLGTVEEDPDDLPIPANPCVTGACIDGVPFEVPVDNDTPCVVGGGSGTCKDGVCAIPCDPGNGSVVCDDDNPCTDDSCGSDMFCVNDPLNQPLPDGFQTDGDCKVQTCDNGEQVEDDDDADPPVPANECEVGDCSNGVGVVNPAPQGQVCTNGVCDGQGQCAGCVVDGNCVADFAPDCGSVACNNGTCDTTLAPSGTPVPNQTSGDCQEQICDGAGMVTAAVDTSDVPTSPGACTLGICVGGTPSTTSAAAGTTCGGANICDGQGACCTPSVCGANDCGSVPSGCNTTLGCGGCAEGVCGLAVANVCSCADNVQNNGEQGVDCGGPCTTACGGGASCNVPADCASGFCVDGVCCNSSCSGPCQACAAALNGVVNGQCLAVTNNTDPDNDCATQAPSTCGTTGICVSGACAQHSGNVCAAATCVGATFTDDSICNGMGACQAPGSIMCVSPYLCAPNQCQSCSDGIVNGNETDVDCGGGGACADCTLGDACSVGGDCVSGFCVDGVCCNTACVGTCTYCDGANAGTCSFVPAGQDPDNECPGNNNCNGAGSC
jgi:hypothetical protein